MIKTQNNSSFYSLIAVNAVTIILAVFQQWNFFTLVWVYWLQSVIIGLFQFFKILDLKHYSTKGFKINDHSVQPSKGVKYYTAFFFAFHFGFFHLIYAVFLFTGVREAEWRSILMLGGLFFFNHLFSYIKNRRQDREREKNIGTMMFFPYVRIIPMHLTILFGMFFIGGPISLVFFLLLKTAADVIMHEMEHRFKVV